MPSLVKFETIPDLFNKISDHYRGKNVPALSYKDRRTKEWVHISWEELERRVQAFAGYLHSTGFKSGDRIAILSENRPEWAIADLATQILGGINVSLYTSLPASQVEYILNDSGATVFVVSTGIQLKKAEEVYETCPALEHVVTMSEMRKEHPEYVVSWDDALEAGEQVWLKNRDVLSGEASNVQETDLASLIYTSGTTGNPKGVMLTHRNLCTNTQSALDLVDFGPGDRHLSFLPLCHSFERTGGYLAVMAAGARIYYAESIDTVARNLTEVRPTVMISVPRLFEKMYNAIVRSVADASALRKSIFDWSLASGRKAADAARNGGVGPLLKMRRAIANKLVFSKLHEKLGNELRFAVSGGAALPREIGEFFEAAGVKVIEGYGLTETSPVLTLNPISDPRYGTVGRVISGVTIAIQRLSDGSIVGQVEGHETASTLTSEEGEIVARGPNIMKGYWNNEDATREAIDADGWYHTGDVGRFKDGYLQITDRIKHMIVSKGGKNIYPGPIEDLLKQYGPIEQMLVVGEGRDFLGALVVPDLDVLKSFAKENGLSYAGDDELLALEEVQKLFETEFKRYSRGTASHEKIRRFRLIAEPFTVENNMLTPTMKPRRKAITQHYEELIEEMYAS